MYNCIGSEIEYIISASAEHIIPWFDIIRGCEELCEAAVQSPPVNVFVCVSGWARRSRFQILLIVLRFSISTGHFHDYCDREILLWNSLQVIGGCLCHPPVGQAQANKVRPLSGNSRKNRTLLLDSRCKTSTSRQPSPLTPMSSNRERCYVPKLRHDHR